MYRAPLHASCACCACVDVSDGLMSLCWQCYPTGQLARAEKELTDQLKLVQVTRKRACRLALRQQRDRVSLLHDAFVLYVVTGCALEAPGELVRQHRHMFDGDLRTLLEERFLQTSVEELANFDCTEGHLRPAVHRRTKRFFKEWQLAQWVNRVNEDSGTAPGYSDILAWKNKLSPAVPAGDDETSPQPQTEKMWIRRWRRRWGANLGRLRTQSGGDVEMVSRKAGDLG